MVFVSCTVAAFVAVSAVYAAKDMIKPLDEEDYVTNSCVGKEDGTYWLKFSDLHENHNVVQLECSNEYVILDPSKDESLGNYFSSFEMWHYATAGPKNSDPVNWEDWFLGHLANEDGSYDNSKSEFLVSPDCSVCDESSDRQLQDKKSSYWMTGLLAKLYWKFFGLPECDMNYETYECYDCSGCTDPTLSCDHVSLDTAQSSDDFDYTGICTSAIHASNKKVYTTRSDATGMGGDWVYKPSIGTNGKFCTCYKPTKKMFKEFELTDKDKAIMTNADSSTDVTDSKKMEKKEEEEEEETEPKVYFLSKEDFEKGPYRIRESGTYIIMEDIVFNFGKGNEYPYFPSVEEDTADLYPGAGAYRGPWHMGYFAGITVECDDVTIDLNGFELKQSYETYFTQRFFSIIELSSQQFLPGVGPAFFGHNPAKISNVVIKNGVLGRSSHFGIHGNYPTNVKIENIHIKDFATHGVHLDGWKDLEMTNVEVGPSATFEYVRGDFTHARIILPRLKAILEDMEEAGTADTKLLGFANRQPMKLADIIDVMEFEMDLAYDYALNRVYNRFSENDFISPDLLKDAKNSPLWKSAKDQFAWENGLPCATSIHGIFLNQQSASTQTFTLSTSKPSTNAKLENIKIHDLKHSFYETFMIMRTSVSETTEEVGNIRESLPVLDLIPWNIPIDGRAVFGFDEQRAYDYFSTISNYYDDGIEDESYQDFDYIGSSLADSILAMTYFSDDWGYLGLERITDTFLSWTQGIEPTTRFEFACNKDIMHHAGKGLLGLRIDGSQNVELSNIYVYNLYEETPLGATYCGQYSEAGEDLRGVGAGAHLRQVTPMQIGFSGNNLNGISIVGSQNVEFKNEIFVYNLNNLYAEGHGIAIWPNTEVTIKSDTNIVVSDLNMGAGLTDEMIETYGLSWESRPNRIPESCAIRLENKDNDNSGTLVESKFAMEDNGENINLLSCNIVGNVKCLGEESNGLTMFGDFEELNSGCNQHFVKSEFLTTNDLSGIENIDEFIDINRKNNVGINKSSWVAGYKWDKWNIVTLISCFILIGLMIMGVQFCRKNFVDKTDKVIVNDDNCEYRGYGTIQL